MQVIVRMLEPVVNRHLMHKLCSKTVVCNRAAVLFCVELFLFLSKKYSKFNLCQLSIEPLLLFAT